MKARKKHPDEAARKEAAGASTTQMPRRRVWFRFAALAMPVLALLFLELALRVAGYGYSPDFFLKRRMSGQEVFIENQQFSRRYFPPGLERTPQPVMFSAAKPADTIRVFVLGESAAMGDPEPAYGFPRILEVQLREAMPAKKVEVINVAVTAINSHVIREIAKDCADKQGDYWIVYMGNNEVVGPFGAGTVFGQQVPGLAFIRANIALKGTRLGQLFEAARLKLSGGAGVPKTWEGMEMFLQQRVAQDDPRMAKVYEHFEANLRDIIRLGEESGAKVLVSTVASNLKDCAPFASLHGTHLRGGAEALWERPYQAGISHQRAGEYAAALASYADAAKLDDRYAELHFRIGRCELARGKLLEAKTHFEMARDLDALRFRADTHINDTVARAASSQGGSVSMIEARAALASGSTNEIAGDELFYEHVHPRFAGNYLLAAAFADRILNRAANAASMLSAAECARRLAFTDFDQYRVLDEVRQRLQQPPFITQLGHEERDLRIGGELKRLDKSSFTNALAVYEQAVARAPGDWVLRENFATLLQDFDQAREAEAQWRKVAQLLPHYEQAWYGLGNLLDAGGRSAEAVASFREALRLRPGSFEARNGLALALSAQGKLAEAVVELERVVHRKPEFVEARVNLGQALAQQGRHAEAAAQYQEALRQQSNSIPARINLGKLLAVQGKHNEAMEQYREALRLKPDHAVAHYNLGNALNALGLGDEATASFAEAVKGNPRFPEARYNLALGLAKQNRNAEVIEHLSEAVRLRPSFIEARFNLGVALARAGRFEEAADQFRETLKLDPANAAAKRFLEQAQARRQ